MTTQTPADSPALQLIRHVWLYRGHQQARSALRHDQDLREAVRLAILAGLRFDRDDFARMARGDRGEVDYAADETDYALACGQERGRENRSAALAYEQWKNRMPFLWPDPGTHTPTRIYVGRRIGWQGEYATCTSFAADGQSVTLCSYHPPEVNEHGYTVRVRVKRRYRLTRDALRAARTQETATR